MESKTDGFRLGTYINFQGRCREAMEHYQRVLGGSLEMYTVDESGTPRAAGDGDRIQHAQLTTNGAVIIATDGHPKFPAQVGENMAISLAGTDRERVGAAFKALADGGEVKMPLTDAAWGTSGWLADRFGITWSVSVQKG